LARTSSAKDLSRLLALSATVVVIAALYFAREILVPLALAILFTFVLTPLVALLEKIRLPRFLAVLLVVILAGAGIGLVGWSVGNQLLDVTNQLPDYKSNIKAKIDSLHSPKSRRLDAAENAVKELGKEITDTSTDTAESAANASKIAGRSKNTTPKAAPIQIVQQQPSTPVESLSTLVTPLGSAVIVIVLTMFMLVGREDLRNRLIGLVGHGHLNVMTQALTDAGSRVSRYLLLQLLVNTCYGAVIGLGLFFIGVPNAFLWAVVAGVFRFLPYIGAPLAAVLPILLSLAIFSGWTKPAETVGLYFGMELLVANVLEPMLYGANTGISSFAILLAAIFWTLIWGPIGLLLSTPLTVCLVVMGRHVPALNFLNIMLGDQPVLPPEAHYYQRLLAADQGEAKRVLEDYLKNNSLEELYDGVVIPALAMAEQDRHADDLESSTEEFIFHSTRDFVEELGEKSKEEQEAGAAGIPADSDALVPAEDERASCAPGARVVCLPARDEADEIVGTMLAQLLQRAGFEAAVIAMGTAREMLEQMSEAKPEIVCISALPPFALLHARDLYRKVRATYGGRARVIIGLWNFSGDAGKAATRLNISGSDKLAMTLAATIEQVGLLGKEGTGAAEDAWPAAVPVVVPAAVPGVEPTVVPTQPD
jgi:predicted PurR-regulated permease PerM